MEHRVAILVTQLNTKPMSDVYSMINFVLLVKISARYIIRSLITAVSVEGVSCEFFEMSVTEEQKGTIKILPSSKKIRNIDYAVDASCIY